MELQELLNKLGLTASTGIVLIILSFIKIPKIEVNVWQFIGKALSKGLTATISEELQQIKNDLTIINVRVNDLNKSLDKHVEKYNEDLILSARQTILRFNDEIIQGVKHTQEHFDEILTEIDKYEDYCVDHPRFPNNKCVMACENIKSTYKEILETNTFLKPKKDKGIRDD